MIEKRFGLMVFEAARRTPTADRPVRDSDDAELWHAFDTGNGNHEIGSGCVRIY